MSRHSSQVLTSADPEQKKKKLAAELATRRTEPAEAPDLLEKLKRIWNIMKPFPTSWSLQMHDGDTKHGKHMKVKVA